MNRLDKHFPIWNNSASLALGQRTNVWPKVSMVHCRLAQCLLSDE